MVAKINHKQPIHIEKPSWSSRATDALVITALLLGNYFVFPHITSDVAAENGILENLEVLFLFLAMLFFLYASRHVSLKTIGWFSAVVCFSFILREVDVEDLSLPQWLIVIGSGKGRNALIVALSLFTLWQLFKQINYRMIVPLLATRFAFYMYWVFLCLVLSWLFDKGVVKSDSSNIFEELSEVNAYALILFSAVIYRNEFRAC